MDTWQALERNGVVSFFWLLVVWCAWWLGCVNWQKAWPMLAAGGWAPMLLIAAISAGVWSFLEPRACTCLPVVTIPNGWWQLGEVSLLILVALFCGWLQGRIGWHPPEMPVEPAPHGHGHDHAHGNGHAAH